MKMRKGNSRVIRVIVSGTISVLSSTAALSAGAEMSASELKGTYGAELEVLGAVQRIDVAHYSLIVAGQHVSIAKGTSFSIDGVAVADAARALGMIQSGDLVAVQGEIGAPAKLISRLKESYVAGATTVYVKGKLTSVDSSVGLAKIGELNVDLTPAMADSKVGNLEVGQVAEVVGMQPSSGGRLLANSIIGTSKVSPDSIIGTSKVAPDSIIGTSKVSPDSIIGTSKVAPNSIIGTSKVSPDSIIGTSKVAPNSIIGTSKVSPDSIIGTSKVSPDSIIGTSKVSPNSIIGTSKVSPDSIIGTSN